MEDRSPAMQGIGRILDRLDDLGQQRWRGMHDATDARFCEMIVSGPGARTKAELTDPSDDLQSRAYSIGRAHERSSMQIVIRVMAQVCPPHNIWACRLSVSPIG